MKKILYALTVVLSLTVVSAKFCSCTDEIKDEIKDEGDKYFNELKSDLKKITDKINQDATTTAERVDELTKIKADIQKIAKSHSPEEIKAALDKHIPDWVRDGIIAFLTPETTETE